MQLKETSIEHIEPMRIQYLKSLTEFQDYYVEFQVSDSACYLIFEGSREVGYIIISSDDVLIEFFVIEDFAAKAPEYLSKIITNSEVSDSINEIYSKTFDSILLSSCLTLGLEYSVAGWLYRAYTNVHMPLEEGIEVRFATQADLPFLQAQEDEVFEPKDMLSLAIDSKTILIFTIREQMLGCGFINQVHSSWNYYDVGVWISPNHRRKGYATQIICYLKKYCEQNGFIPICGCSADNVGSQRALQKAGFISKHRLVEFFVSGIDISQN